MPFRIQPSYSGVYQPAKNGRRLLKKRWKRTGGTGHFFLMVGTGHLIQGLSYYQKCYLYIYHERILGHISSLLKDMAASIGLFKINKIKFGLI